MRTLTFDLLENRFWFHIFDFPLRGEQIIEAAEYWTSEIAAMKWKASYQYNYYADTD